MKSNSGNDGDDGIGGIDDATTSSCPRSAMEESEETDGSYDDEIAPTFDEAAASSNRTEAKAASYDEIVRTFYNGTARTAAKVTRFLKYMKSANNTAENTLKGAWRNQVSSARNPNKRIKETNEDGKKKTKKQIRHEALLATLQGQLAQHDSSNILKGRTKEERGEVLDQYEMGPNSKLCDRIPKTDCYVLHVPSQLRRVLRAFFFQPVIMDQFINARNEMESLRRKEHVLPDTEMGPPSYLDGPSVLYKETGPAYCPMTICKTSYDVGPYWVYPRTLQACQWMLGLLYTAKLEALVKTIGVIYKLHEPMVLSIGFGIFPPMYRWGGMHTDTNEVRGGKVTSLIFPVTLQENSPPEIVLVDKEGKYRPYKYQLDQALVMPEIQLHESAQQNDCTWKKDKDFRIMTFLTVVSSDYPTSPVDMCEEKKEIMRIALNNPHRADDVAFVRNMDHTLVCQPFRPSNWDNETEMLTACEQHREQWFRDYHQVVTSFPEVSDFTSIATLSGYSLLHQQEVATASAIVHRQLRQLKKEESK